MIDDIKIYVYSSCHFSETLANDDVVGTGGFGVVINLNGKQIDEISGGFSYTTNARMDISGIIEGLKKISKVSNIVVYLTNEYVINALAKGWLEKWKRKGFVKRKHADLWKMLDQVMHEIPHNFSFKHSKEVSRSKDFQRAVELAKAMSGKRNLPIDVGFSAGKSLFEIQPTGNDPEPEIIDDKPILDSISVDASSIGNPGIMEYRGVDTRTREVIFQRKYAEATNNIGEFLAIVHALALFKKEGKELRVIYSDSLNAISWVKQKKCKTKFERTEKNGEVFDHIRRAVAWLENNPYSTKILKWNTAAWGEIPADFGRK